MTRAFDDVPDAEDSYVADGQDSGPAAAQGTGGLRRDGSGATALLGTIDHSAVAAPVLLLDRARPPDVDRARQPGGRGGARARYSTRRLPGLDGLRAIAVLSVVTFHLDFSLAPGGFLGVDVFFVISGFLITNVLASEILDTGGLRLGRFYLRRARRLLPTVLALLLATTIAAHTLWRDQLATLHGGVLSSLTYVTNWWLIADHQSYFTATGRPSMFEHLWSLAIEEQFYLVWSAVVVIVAGVAAATRRAADPAVRLERVVILALVLAVASTAAMAVYAMQADLPYDGSTSRVYFGSDTHSMGLFLGSAAGAWWALRQYRSATATARGKAHLVGSTDILGLVALGVLGYQFFETDEFSAGLYRGGLLVFDAVALLAVLCAVRKGSLFGRVLDMRPIRWVGQRSYSIYIWHWPVVVATRPGLDIAGSVVLINLGRLALILAVSALSYHFVEVPLRSGQFATWRRERRTRTARRGELVAVLTVLAATVALCVAADPPGTAHPPSSARGALVPAALTATPTAQPVAPSPAPSGLPSPLHSIPAASGSSHAPTRPAPAAKPSLSAFGDSVLLGAAPALRVLLRRLDLDAVEGRQAFDVLNDVARDEQHGWLQPYVLIHVGNNGIISPDQLGSTLHALAPCTRVVLMTDRVARDWQDPNNATIRSVGARFRNVVVVDWHALAAAHHGWLYSDGLHLLPAGVAAYTRIVLTAAFGAAA